MLFKKNISFVDQIVRAILIVDLLAPCLLGLLSEIVSYLFISFSIVLFISCVTRYCWIYDLFNISTSKQEINY
ncbi:YgaP family membrane protein [Spirosoma foliorum]|uniref:DUF2892 domain-containing protein n=1 Tax=Spirosoma foliorum TaxID=2710596 RepID=A0A7G5H5N8_9BACT|nr:DUF2892 domain-containing protein [Spirosoma foliorum]QMW06430.1 DUF2892 domain-containing protein [Spirosoma foliorum]